MRSQRWIVLFAVLLAALVGVLIAGVPHSQEHLDLKPLPTTTTTVTGGSSSPSTTTTTAP